MIDANTFEPTRPHACKVWERLDEDRRRTRLAEAQWRERLLRQVKALTLTGMSQRQAVTRVEGLDRSNYRRWKRRYRELGLEGLIDWRMPPVRTRMPDDVRSAICTLRRLDARMAVDKIVAHVQKYHAYTTSVSTVRRVLRQAGLSRRGGPLAGTGIGETRLELGGMKILEAAAVETKYLGSLAEGIIGVRDCAQMPEPQPEVDTSGRDEYGRFLSSYNERYRTEDGQELGPGFDSVENKRLDKDLQRLHLFGAGISVVERKLWALMVSPLLGNGRWDGIRVARGQLLGELCGYPYMPSTLDLFTRELKYLGVSSTLWEIHARLWYAQTQAWGDTRSAAVLYVDDTNKPLWTVCYSQSTAVS